MKSFPDLNWAAAAAQISWVIIGFSGGRFDFSAYHEITLFHLVKYVSKSPSLIECLSFIKGFMAAINTLYISDYSQIRFTADAKGLFVEIQTARMLIQSIGEKELDLCRDLYSRHKVMQTIEEGKPLSDDTVRKRVAFFVQNWRMGNPFNAVMTVRQGDKFLGLVGLTPSNKGDVEIWGLGLEECWNKGFGTELARVFLSDYIPALIKEGYTVGKERVVPKRLVASVKPGNTFSEKIITKTLKMQYSHEALRFGAMRKFYARKISDIQKQKESELAEEQIRSRL